MYSIYVNSRNSTWNNSGFSVVTTRNLARDPCNIADLFSWVSMSVLTFGLNDKKYMCGCEGASFHVISKAIKSRIMFVFYL